MSLQYLSDNSGRTTAVVVPIEEWNELRIKHPEIDKMEGELPQWQKDIIDQRMLHFRENPHDVTSLDGFLKELDEEGI